MILTCSKKDHTCPTASKGRILLLPKRKTASIEAATEAKRSRVEQVTADDAKAPQKGRESLGNGYADQSNKKGGQEAAERSNIPP